MTILPLFLLIFEQLIYSNGLGNSGKFEPRIMTMGVRMYVHMHIRLKEVSSHKA